MAVPKLTPWFPGYVQPARPGVYMREYVPWGLCFSKFKDGKWYYPGWTEQSAASQPRLSDCQSAPWRGLAEEPKP